MHTMPPAPFTVPVALLAGLLAGLPASGAAQAQAAAPANARTTPQANAQAKPRAKAEARGDARRQARAAAKPMVLEAKRFLAQTETRLASLDADQARAGWVAAHFPNDDSAALAAHAGALRLAAASEAALAARRFNGLNLSNTDARKLRLLQRTLALPDPQARADYVAARAALAGAYGKAGYCPAAGRPCPAPGEPETVLATSRDPAKLQAAWTGWHAQASAYKERYAGFVQLSNRGARAMGYADTGELWRAGHDMPPGEFTFEMERLWLQVRPLYEALHEYARYKLRVAYGPDVVPLTGPVPAHLFGDMWGRTWDNIYPLLAPAQGAAGADLARMLEKNGTTPARMDAYAEDFYTSLGLPKLPAAFQECAPPATPRGRDAIHHATAWPAGADDACIGMPASAAAGDFAARYRALGHAYYLLAWQDQPVLFRHGAGDGFDEAVGDAIALSITPGYLHGIGLMQDEPDAQADIGELLRRALSKVPVLPFAYSVDRWRWDVQAGTTQPADYDLAWWQSREHYMGMRRPGTARFGSGDGFDAGAEYHVPADVPYAGHFIAGVLQFQLHRALCREAGHEGPLHRCSIHGSAKAGRKLQAMMQLGSSKPWQEALKAVSGEERLDGDALLEYFAPLKTWLDEQNRILASQQKG